MINLANLSCFVPYVFWHSFRSRHVPSCLHPICTICTVYSFSFSSYDFFDFGEILFVCICKILFPASAGRPNICHRRETKQRHGTAHAQPAPNWKRYLGQRRCNQHPPPTQPPSHLVPQWRPKLKAVCQWKSPRQQPLVCEIENETIDGWFLYLSGRVGRNSLQRVAARGRLPIAHRHTCYFNFQ